MVKAVLVNGNIIYYTLAKLLINDNIIMITICALDG